MGKKKKLKMSKAGTRVISRGFNDLTDSERESLKEHYEKLFSGQLDALQQVSKSSDEDENEYASSFDQELNNIMSNARYNDENKLEFGSKSSIDEYKGKAKDYVDPDLTEGTDKDDEDDDVSHDFEYIVQVPITYDEDYQQVNIISNMKNAESYNLFDVLNNIEDIPEEVLDADQTGELALLFKSLIVFSTHPTILVDKTTFDRSFVKGLNRLPKNAYVYKISYDYVVYMGILLVDANRFNEVLNRLFKILHEKNICAYVLNEMIPIISRWAFDSVDVPCLTSPYIQTLNQYITESIVEYCHVYGDTVVECEPGKELSIDDYIQKLKDNERFIDLDSNVRERCEDRLQTELDEILSSHGEWTQPEDSIDDEEDADSEEDQSDDTDDEADDDVDDTTEESTVAYHDEDRILSNSAMLAALAGINIDDDKTDKVESKEEEPVEVADVNEMPDVTVEGNKANEDKGGDEWVFLPGVGVVKNSGGK